METPLEEITPEFTQQLIGIATRLTEIVSGTDAFWMGHRAKLLLEAAVDHLRSRAVSPTYSVADHHWHDLHRLMLSAGDESPPEEDSTHSFRERNRALVDNPPTADWWVWQRMQIRKEAFLGEHMAVSLWHCNRAASGSLVLQQPACARVQLVGLRERRALTDLSRTRLKGFFGRRSWINGALPDANGGVPDAEQGSVQTRICSFLEGVGSTARNPTLPSEGVHLSAESRAEGVRELAKDMRNFDWDDEAAGRLRYALLVNVSVAQRHTRCGTYCLRYGCRRFGFPHERIDRMAIPAHPFVTPPTDIIEDWQVVALPPPTSPPPPSRRRRDNGRGRERKGAGCQPAHCPSGPGLGTKHGKHPCCGPRTGIHVYG